MALDDALKCLKSKYILGEYGPTTRPFVILDIDEHTLILKAIESTLKNRKVPRETSRSRRSESQVI